MRLSKQLFADSNARPEGFERMDTEFAVESAFFRRIDSGFLWHNPVVTRICQRVNLEISTICEDAWFDPIITPSLMDVGLLERSGKFDQFASEFYVAEGMVMSATSEEYLLALTETCNISHAQLPIRTYELKDAFRNIKRPKWILKARQFSGVVLSSLWRDVNDTEQTLRLFSEIMKEVSVRLNFALDEIPKMWGCEYVYPCDNRDAYETPDGRNVSGIGVAMWYPYQMTSAFNAKYHTANNVTAPLHMGTCGIWTLRCLFSSMDANRDGMGFLLPDAIRPFDHAVIILDPEDAAQLSLADSVASKMKKEGFSVYVDDRKTSAKSKLDFADFIWTVKKFVIWKKECLRGEPEIRERKSIS